MFKSYTWEIHSGNMLSSCTTLMWHRSATAIKLPAGKSSKFFPSNFHLYFKSRANFVGCRGSQMPIKWCKMFYRSFKTNFCITFLLQLYRGKTFSCKLISGWELCWSHDCTWTVVYVVKLHDINTAI